MLPNVVPGVNVAPQGEEAKQDREEAGRRSSSSTMIVSVGPAVLPPNPVITRQRSTEASPACQPVAIGAEAESVQQLSIVRQSSVLSSTVGLSLARTRQRRVRRRAHSAVLRLLSNCTHTCM